MPSPPLPPEAQTIPHQRDRSRSGLAGDGRLLVAVGPDRLAEQLVRWTHRMATMSGAPWIAVHVETSQLLTKTAQQLLDKSLTLARELGAEVVIIYDANVAAALVRVALERKAAQIIIGQPRRSPWLRWFRSRTLADHLLEIAQMVELHVVPVDAPTATELWPQFDLVARSDWREYVLVLVVITALTAGAMLLPKTYYVQIGLVYLLAIHILSLRVGRGPILTAGVLIALTWDFIFVPPYFNIDINNIQDAVLLVTYFVVALLDGQLTARIRAQARNERLREERATSLFQFTRVLAEAKTLAAAADAAVLQMNDLLKAQTALALVEEDREGFVPHFKEPAFTDAQEQRAALLAFQNRRPAGRFTNTLPNSTAYYAPLVRADRAFGVLGVKMPPQATLTLGQRDLLDAFAQQLALIVEREHLHAASEREKILAESEKLHRVLLESVSHELRTPLAVITATSDELADANIPACKEMVAEIREAGQRLNRVVGNLLDQTRLESGALRPHLDWCDPQDLVNAAVESTLDAMVNHPLEIAIPSEMTFIRADFTLTEQALVNLLLNAALHTPPGTPVLISAEIEAGGQRVFFAVADRGPGLPATMRNQLFNKFTRGATAPAGGLGLGLSIVHGFIVAQGGEVILGDNPGGGAKITLYLPYIAPENPPPE